MVEHKLNEQGNVIFFNMRMCVFVRMRTHAHTHRHTHTHTFLPEHVCIHIHKLQIKTQLQPQHTWGGGGERGKVFQTAQ